MKPDLPVCGGVLAVIALLAGCGKPDAVAPVRPTHVIVILADDLGYGDLGCYGQPRIRTPNIDRMAAEGVRFSQAYAGSSVCSPSRCSLLTGFDMGHAFIRGNSPEPPLPANTVTVAGVMRGAGYSTALIGKWDSGAVGTSGEPMRQGFEYFFGYDGLVAAHNNWPAFLWRNGEKVALPNKVREVKPYYSETPGGVAYEKKAYAPEILAGEVMRYVGEHRGVPFFLMWTPTIPHANDEASGNGIEVPDEGVYAGEKWPGPERDYAAAVTILDSEVGRLLDYLRREALDRDTLVVFASDNGPHREGGVDPGFFGSNGGFRGCKRDLYEGGIRVPLIVWGGGVAPGKFDGSVALWDVAATVTKLAGREPIGNGRPLPIAGEPVVPSDGRMFYWEMHEAPVARAIRMGKWKLIDFYEEGRMELYNIELDAGERHDVAADNPAVVRELAGRMDRARTPSPYWNISRSKKEAGH